MMDERPWAFAQPGGSGSLILSSSSNPAASLSFWLSRTRSGRSIADRAYLFSNGKLNSPVGGDC